MIGSKISGSIPMLIQRCALEHHRLIIPVSVTKPIFTGGSFGSVFDQGHYRALVDTGAQRTVLSRSIITQRQLTRTGHMEFAGLHGARTHSRYLANIGLWADQPELGGAQTLYQLEDPVEVVDMENNRNFDLIIGFDVLKLFSFSYDKNAKSFELIVKQ